MTEKRLSWGGCLMGMFTLGLFCVSVAGAQEVKVLADRSVVRALPKVWAFENLADRLFRNVDGTVLYLGPGLEKEFFIIRSEDDVREIEAPSTGKAYMNAEGQFVIWYDRLDKGVQFKGGHELKFSDPTKSRFGVACGAAYFYTYEEQESRIFRTEAPTAPVLSLPEFYVVRIAATVSGELLVCGFRSEGIRQVRKQEVQRWQWVEGTYVLTKTFEVPRHYQVMDMDPVYPKVLLLNESQLAPQVYDWDLKEDRIWPIGTVNSFAFYMNKDFAIGEDMLDKFRPASNRDR